MCGDNPDGSGGGIEWTSETDRLLVMQMLIKLSAIGGPAKPKDQHLGWVSRLSEEFCLQGDTERALCLPVSPYMDRGRPQIAKLQVTFIYHVLSPLCNTLFSGGLLPGRWATPSPAQVPPNSRSLLSRTSAHTTFLSINYLLLLLLLILM